MRHTLNSSIGDQTLTETLGRSGNEVQFRLPPNGTPTPTFFFSPTAPRENETIQFDATGSKDELADLALYLCSDAASFITGAVYICDGGHSLCRGGIPAPGMAT